MDPRGKYVPPSIDRRSFNCSHCGAYAKQEWFSGQCIQIDPFKTPEITKDFSPVPVITENKIQTYKDHLKNKTLKSISEGNLVFVDYRGASQYSIGNLYFSRCAACNEVALWIQDQLFWPRIGQAPLPNPDLSQDIRRDYDEAGSILQLSPRGAAALLRLAIQKLCKELGEKGANINDDIKALVAKGLPVQVQQALDVVRVIGNGAVHPGELDLRDDRATAESLFGLVNLIAEIMISQKKHVAEMYARLPKGALEAIQRRDGN